MSLFAQLPSTGETPVPITQVLLRQPGALDDGGIRLTGMPDDGAGGEKLGESPRMPRQVAGGP